MTEVSGMPKPDWYLKINPVSSITDDLFFLSIFWRHRSTSSCVCYIEKRGKVPALRIPTEQNAVIYESAICNEFLCDYATKLQKHHTLMPTDPIKKAQIRLLNDHCDNVFSKTQFTYLMNKNDEMNESLCAEMEDALICYEDALGESKGPYFMGECFTNADLHVFPFIQRLVITLKHWKDYELPSDKFPNLLAWHDSCLERESVSQSSMSKEKTIEVYGRFVSADYKFGGLNTSK